MLESGMKYSNYIFLISCGVNFNQYYDFYDTEIVDTHGCFSIGTEVTNFAYSVGIYHDYVVSPVILGISYSNIYELGIMIGIKF